MYLLIIIVFIMKKKNMKKNPPERGRWRRILAIGMCGCVSVCMYADVLKSQGGHSLKEATLKTAFEQVLVFPVVESPVTGIKEVSQEGFRVKGKVTDALGPLPGVNVMVKGSMTGVITDVEGNYEIVAPYSKASLVFSYVGYQPREIQLTGRGTLDVTLIEDTKALEEVVVVGYNSKESDHNRVCCHDYDERLEAKPDSQLDQCFGRTFTGVDGKPVQWR